MMVGSEGVYLRCPAKVGFPCLCFPNRWSRLDGCRVGFESPGVLIEMRKTACDGSPLALLLNYHGKEAFMRRSS